MLLCCKWVRGGGKPKVKLGELCILGEGVWLLLLWLLQRTRLRVFSDAEPDRQLPGKITKNNTKVNQMFYLFYMKKNWNSLVETLWRGSLAAVVVYSCWGVGVAVRVQAFGVADVLEDPGSEICQAGVLWQNQPRPRVRLYHVQGGDGYGTPHLVHSITWVYFRIAFSYNKYCLQFVCSFQISQTLKPHWNMCATSTRLEISTKNHSCTLQKTTILSEWDEVLVEQSTLVSESLPVQIFLECILGEMMEVGAGLPVRCHGRQVGWCSWFFPCYSCTPKCSCWQANNRNKWIYTAVVFCNYFI